MRINKLIKLKNYKTVVFLLAGISIHTSLVSCGGRASNTNTSTGNLASGNINRKTYDMAEYLSTSRISEDNPYHKFSARSYEVGSGLQTANHEFEEEALSSTKYSYKITTTGNHISRAVVNKGFSFVNPDTLVSQIGEARQTGTYTYTSKRYVDIGDQYSGTNAFSRTDIKKEICTVTDHYDSFDLGKATRPEYLQQGIYHDVIKIDCHELSSLIRDSTTYYAKGIGSILAQLNGIPPYVSSYIIYQHTRNR